jgi:hypothetical protein
MAVPCGRGLGVEENARFSRFAEATEGHLRHLPRVRRQRLASLNRDASFHGTAKGGGRPAARCHRPPRRSGRGRAEPRDDVEVGQDGQPVGRRELAVGAAEV